MSNPYHNIDYDRAIMMGGKFDGMVLDVRKSTQKVIFPIVDEKQLIQPFGYDNDFDRITHYRKLEYYRVGETHIFYCGKDNA